MKLFIAESCVCCGSTKLESSQAVMMPFVSARALGYHPIRIDTNKGLRDLKEGYAYQLCRSLECVECGHLFMDIRFGNKEMESLYRNYRQREYIELREKYEPGYTERNTRLEEGYDYIDKVEEFLGKYLRKNMKILDWGGDSGINTPFKDSAREVHIYDISNKETISERFRKVDLNYAGSQDYDLIVCSNVLEHVPMPIDQVMEIKEYMNDNTLLYIEVPLEKIIAEKKNDKDMVYSKKIHWHEHINFYTPDSLLRLCDVCSLDVIEFKIGESSSAGVPANMQQVAARLGGIKNG